jgi:hypothetical protein
MVQYPRVRCQPCTRAAPPPSPSCRLANTTGWWPACTSGRWLVMPPMDAERETPPLHGGDAPAPELARALKRSRKYHHVPTAGGVGRPGPRAHPSHSRRTTALRLSATTPAPDVASTPNSATAPREPLSKAQSTVATTPPSAAVAKAAIATRSLPAAACGSSRVNPQARYNGTKIAPLRAKSTKYCISTLISLIGADTRCRKLIHCCARVQNVRNALRREKIV